MLVDTHTHLYLEKFNNDRTQVIQRAVKKGVEKFFLPNIDSRYIQALLKLSHQYPSRCYPMMGLHPGSVDEDYEKELQTIKDTLEQVKFYAVGEIGMDLYWDDTYQKEQKKAFVTQINWAKELGLPIVIHCRDAYPETLDILETHNDEDLYGIFHCFTAGLKEAKRIIDLGNFWLGIGGIVTFKNADLDQTIKEVALDNIVLETDSPFLAPEPNRGKRNESSFLVHIAQKVAELHDTSVEKVGEITSANSETIFGV